jgi:hypothetical protein
LLFLAACGDAMMIFSLVLFYWLFFIIGVILAACGLFGICLFRIMKWKTFRRKYAIGAPVVIGLVAFVGVMFMFTYLHQAQTQQTFRVTVSWFDTYFTGEYSWKVHIRQLSYQELENARVLIGNGESPFPSLFNPKSADGNAQQEFGCYPQPQNITIVWDGGRETFVLNHYPFDGLDPYRIFKG